MRIRGSQETGTAQLLDLVMIACSESCLAFSIAFKLFCQKMGGRADMSDMAKAAETVLRYNILAKLGVSG